MTDSIKLSRTAAMSTLALALTAAIASPAAAQNPLNSVIGCEAAGNNQRNGAILGGLLGAAAGAAVADKDAKGALIGGLLGAATGSYVGCQKQVKEQAQTQYPDYGYQYGNQDYDRYDRGYQQPTYGQNVPVARGVQRANFTPMNQRVVASTKVNLRSGPTTSSARVGQLYAGEAIEALATVRGTDWVLVGRNGVGIGYVNSAYVRPAGYDRYAQGYRY